ncbi:MAG: DUF1588 domain-containing protein, partial [Myxococcota bacterium]|nr:DUF1588 domain-containing protein [Myxococcota bacterium]
DAAARGALADPAQRRAELERLLDSDRGRAAVRHFYDQWLEVERLETTRKSPELYPEWSDDVRADLLEGTRAFVEHVTLRSEDGTFTELVTSPRPFVSARVAPLYGISAEGLGETPTRVEITEHPRAGILTDMGLMAALAKVHETAPIARGVFVLEQIFCQHAPPPPNDILIEPPPPDPALTTRERYAAHRIGSCAACHDLFDPAGFGLEGFDSLGRYRERENDLPIDTSGLLRLDGEERPFVTPAELAALVAASPRARSCFAQQWFTYAVGRLPESADECTIDELAALVGDDAPIRAVLIALTETDAFRTRRVDPPGVEECR